MSKIIACNKEIKEIKYSGFTITNIYACGGKLVYGNTEPPEWKAKFEYADGSTYYTGKSGNTISSEDFSNYVYSYNGDYSYVYNSYYLNKDNITALTINNSVTTISSNTFQNCSNLETVRNFGNNVTTIGSYAFNNCGNLTSINLTCNVNSIGNNAFSYNTSAKEILLCEGVTEISSAAFYNCNNVSFWYLVLPSTLKYIMTNSFGSCANLKEIVCRATTPPNTLNSDPFQNTHSDLIIYVPASSVNAYKSASGWSTYADRIQPIA